MLRGITCAILACFVWGFVFVIPGFMSHCSPFEVALGRYFFYGLISGFIFLNLFMRGAITHSKPIWLRALFYALLSNFVCYTSLVLALRNSTPTILALILGLSPITIAFYGNARKKEIRFRRLLFPSCLILMGLALTHLTHVESHENLASYLSGIVCGLLTLAIWSWYVVANAQFLKEHPEISASSWSTMIGVSSFFWALFFLSILHLFFSEYLSHPQYSYSDPLLLRFLVGSAILGLVCSWAGAYFWNQASRHLPVALAGHMTIFETIFGITFVYAADGVTPPALEIAGIMLLLGAVVYSIQLVSTPELAQAE